MIKEMKISRAYLDDLAKKRFEKMAGDESLFDKTLKLVEGKLSPKCIYQIFSEIKRDGDVLYLNDEKTLKSDYFKTLPKEILGSIVCYAITIGDISIESDSISDQGMVDILGTAYVDAVRDYLRTDLEEEEYIVGSNLAPGVKDMPFETIKDLDEILDLKSIGVTYNDSYMMTPQKSTTGMYMLFNAVHPDSGNSCDTCMSRGHGCNLCSLKYDD